MTLKEKINGNAKWLRYGSLSLAIIIFILAQGVSNGTKAEGIAHCKEGIVEVKDDLKNFEKFTIDQTDRMARLEQNSEDIKEDVTELKKDSKEMLKLLIEIKNK